MPERLRARARHVRQIARQLNDDQAYARLIDLATDYEAKAAAIERGEATESGATTESQSPGAAPRGGT